jgi:hypothetical protein
MLQIIYATVFRVKRLNNLKIRLTFDCLTGNITLIIFHNGAGSFSS